MINAVNEILGKKICYASRAASMLCIGFGKKCIIKDIKDITYEVYEFRIHIQSFWRVINRKDKRILFAQFDLNNDENVFEKKVHKWISNTENLVVKQIEIGEINDLVIVFENGDALEVYVDCDDKEEAWRYIRCISGKTVHLVMNGNGIRD